jgi:hypothetical protein
LKKRNKWFNIPMQEMPDLKALFRESFEEAFPGEWTSVTTAKSVSAIGEESISLSACTGLLFLATAIECWKRFGLS